MTRIEWSDHASFDLNALATYYSDIAPEFGDVVLSRIYDAVSPLRDNPRLGAPAGDLGVRKWRVKKTMFQLLYVVRGDVITVLRVVHSATDWQQFL